jgi:hypothetical protein
MVRLEVEGDILKITAVKKFKSFPDLLWDDVRIRRVIVRVMTFPVSFPIGGATSRNKNNIQTKKSIGSTKTQLCKLSSKERNKSCGKVLGGE